MMSNWVQMVWMVFPLNQKPRSDYLKINRLYELIENFRPIFVYAEFVKMGCWAIFCQLFFQHLMSQCSPLNWWRTFGWIKIKNNANRLGCVTCDGNAGSLFLMGHVDKTSWLLVWMVDTQCVKESHRMSRPLVWMCNVYSQREMTGDWRVVKGLNRREKNVNGFSCKSLCKLR